MDGGVMKKTCLKLIRQQVCQIRTLKQHLNLFFSDLTSFKQELMLAIITVAPNLLTKWWLALTDWASWSNTDSKLLFDEGVVDALGDVMKWLAIIRTEGGNKKKGFNKSPHRAG